LKKCIDETEQFCQIGSPSYVNSMKGTAQLLGKFRNAGTRIVVMRLPLDPRFIQFENANYKKVFEDFEQLSSEFGIDYLDLSSPEHQNAIGPVIFYGDGQHVEESSSIKISNYLSHLIKTKYNLKS
jgi:hypothetical protein